MNPNQYQIGQEVVPGYTLVRPLGSGMAGDVWVARAAGGMDVALKIVRSLSMLGGRKELKALKTIRNIRHPNLCPVHGFWTKDADGQLLEDGETEAMMPDSNVEKDFITLLPQPVGTMDIGQPPRSSEPACSAPDTGRLHAEELIVVMGLGDCTLHDRLQEVRSQAGIARQNRDVTCGLEAQETIHYLRPAADAIDELNLQHNIYHCDIKPQNILIVGGGAQVCDFGLANRIEGDARKTRHAFATPAYAAPEVLDGKTYSRGVDQYSLAVTYFELRTGQLPFDITTAAKIVQAKCSGRLNLASVSSGERKVLQRAMHVDPAQRYPSCTEFINELAVASGVDRRGGITPLRLSAVGSALIMVAALVGFAIQRFVNPPAPIEVAITTDLADAATSESGQQRKLPEAEEPAPIQPRGATAIVRIRVNTPDAIVRWEDKRYRVEGTETELPMPLGTHAVKVEKPGYEVFVESALAVSLDSENVLDVELIASEIAIVVKTDPPDARLTWNGKTLQRGEDSTVQLPMGTHQIRAEREGFKSETKTIVVADKNNQPTPFKLARLGKSDVEDSPKTADMEVDAVSRQIRIAVVGGDDLDGQLEIGDLTRPLRGGVALIDAADLKGDSGSIRVAVELESEETFSQTVDRQAGLASGKIVLQRPLLRKDEARFMWLFARYAIRGPLTAEIAERQLTEALELDPALGQAYRDRAIARTTLGKTEIARQDFENAIQQMGDNFHLRQEYAKLLARMSVAPDQPNRDRVVEDCKSQCAAALRIREHATGPRLLRAEFLFRQEQNEEAKSEAQRLSEDSIDPEQRSYAWNLLGLIALREGNQGEAFANFKSATAANPASAEAHLNVGRVSRDFGVGAAEAEQTELLEQALGRYMLAVKLNPALRQKVLPLIAQVQEDLGLFEAAIRSYTSLINDFGPTANRYRKRASLYDRIGNAVEATKDRAGASDLQHRQQ